MKVQTCCLGCGREDELQPNASYSGGIGNEPHNVMLCRFCSVTHRYGGRGGAPIEPHEMSRLLWELAGLLKRREG